jgi:hypothetical protein
MHKSKSLWLLSSSLLLSGCAALSSTGIGSFFEDAFRTSQDFGPIDPAFRSSASAACSARAAQYGEVAVSRISKSSVNTLVVDGTTRRNGYPQRAFTCSFDAAGRITDFKRG